MAFNPPLRSDMGAVVLRALRDPNGSVFPSATVNDFIDQAMADLSAYRPKEQMEIAPWPLPTDIPPFSGFTSIWKVECRSMSLPNNYIKTIFIPYSASNADDNRAGWDFYGGTLYIDDYYTRRIDALDVSASVEMWVWGYADHDLPDADTDILDLVDATDYNCVLNHCKSMGFELLTHDRALYQQWLAATNNTDVSPTQLGGMASFAEGTFQRTRARNTKIRRVASSDYLHAH